MGAGRRAGGRLVASAILAAALLAPAALAGPLPPGPTATSGPVVIGIAAAGKRLTGLSGIWTGSGAIGYRFQWDRCNAAGARCLPIVGATSPTYTLVGRDIGKTVGLTVYASDATGTAAGYASLVGPIAAARPPLVATVQPLVNGAPVLGKTISVSTGTWSPMVRTFSYSWERCNGNGRVCAPIPAATRSSYTIGSADLGHALLALVQATNSTTIQNTFSAATPPAVAASVDGPLPLSAPQVTGLMVAGSQLIATTGRWKGVGPISFAFQWYRCDLLGRHCEAVLGATAAAYRLGMLDQGQTIGLTVHASDLTGRAMAYASLVGPVAPATAVLSATSPPTIAGSATVGSALVLEPGTWSTQPSHSSYSWLLCNPNGRFCSPIPGVTTNSYTPTSADSGHTLIGEIAASADGTLQAAFSPATAPIS